MDAVLNFFSPRPRRQGLHFHNSYMWLQKIVNSPGLTLFSQNKQSSSTEISFFVVKTLRSRAGIVLKSSDQPNTQYSIILLRNVSFFVSSNIVFKSELVIHRCKIWTKNISIIIIWQTRRASSFSLVSSVTNFISSSVFFNLNYSSSPSVNDP